MLMIAEKHNALLAEARAWSSADDFFTTDSEWFKVLLTNAKHSKKVDNKLKNIRLTDSNYCRLNGFPRSYGQYSLIALEENKRAVSQLNKQLEDKLAPTLFSFFNSMCDEVLNFNWGLIYEYKVDSVPIAYLRFPNHCYVDVTIANGMTYHLRLSILLPRTIKQDSNFVYIPFNWLPQDHYNFPDKIDNLFGSLKIDVVYCYDKNTEYYYVNDPQLAKLPLEKAYQQYRIKYAGSSWFHRFFHSELTKKDWQKENHNFRLSHAQRAHIVDGKVKDLLLTSKSFQEELINNKKLRLSIDQLTTVFEIFWHDILLYPEVNFRKPQL